MLDAIRSIMAPPIGLVAVVGGDINWQHTPVHNATARSWTALVLVTPFPEAILSSTSAPIASSRCAIPPPADG